MMNHYKSSVRYSIVRVLAFPTFLFLALFVLLNPAVAQVATFPYSNDFESGSLDANWTTATTDAVDGMVDVSTDYTPYEGTYHLVMGLNNNNAAKQTQEAELRVDLSGQTDVEFSFRWKEFGDEDDTDDGIYFSDDDGATFVRVQDLYGESYDNDRWYYFILDVDELASANGLSLNSTFVIKFQQIDDASFTGDGFAFDDISLSVPAAANPDYAAFPYSTDFETGALDSHWITLSDDNTFGRVYVSSDFTPYAGTYHMIMDVETNVASEPTQQARLYIDLSGQTEVQLSFYWKEFNDQSNAEDGIFLSDDGGNTFTLVQALDGDNFANQTWVQYVLDIDALASANGLSLTSTFVIKFQQRGDTNPTNDGFAFDNIVVDSPASVTATYATFPFIEDFETGVLGNHWVTAGGNPDLGIARAQVTTDNGPYAGSYHLTLDNTANTLSISSASLFIDLSGQTDVGLEFYWKEFGDETHTEDGVYISDNGGESFVKALDLEGESYTNNTWNYFLVDIGTEAATNGLSMTDEFVIKFQQYDNQQVTNADGFAFDNIQVAEYTILPVELVDFTAEGTSSGIQLSWNTASETNNSHFVIERSSDGKGFETIASVLGNGTTTSVSNYDYLDKSPLFGINYYRLRQVDYDGATDFSEIVSATYVPEDFDYKIYPVPGTVTTTKLRIQGLDNESTLELKVYNSLGALVHTRTIASQDSGIFEEQLLPNQYFGKGKYLVSVFDGTNLINKKIIIE